MSILDTIEAAKREASEAGSLSFGAKKASDKEVTDKTSSHASEDSQSNARKGALKPALSKAKPAREKAYGVRTTSKKSTSAPQTKEEKRQARKAEREDRDRRIAVARILLSKDPVYKKYQNITWALLAVGFGSIAISWIINIFHKNAYYEPTSPAGMAVIGFVAVAYVLVIISFIYDMRHTRPMRRATDDKVAGMTEKKLRQIIEEDAVEIAEEAERNPSFFGGIKQFFTGK